MTLEFVVFDKAGKEVDWIDPYRGHIDNEDGTFEVNNGYGVYHVEVPEHGRYVIRTPDLENR